MPRRRTGPLKGRKTKKSVVRRQASALRTVAIFASKMNKERTLSERLADFVTLSFGTVMFCVGNSLFFLVWILLNLGLTPLIVPFDPYPFGLLTTIVSLEAILLAIFVLMSQNRAAKVADIREEIDFQINVQAEREITHVLCMLEEVHKALDIKAKNVPELHSMEQNIDLNQLERVVEAELKRLR